jgi:hypothetical protein
MALRGGKVMQFDYRLLKRRIRKVFGTETKFAEAMSQKPASITLKLNNQSEWTQGEINRAAGLLGIADNEITGYFFTEETKPARSSLAM